MYALKQIPEDFIVEEIPEKEFSSEKKKYLIYFLEKKRYNTEDAIIEISRRLNLPRKNIGYAGAKDRNAVTFQYISILGNGQELEIKDIKLKHIGYSDLPISLGNLFGNKFKITIRNLEGEDIEKIKSKGDMKHFINYFDTQRFSLNNPQIGKMIIEKKYKDACEIIIGENSKISEEIKSYLEMHKNAYLNALKIVPRKTLMIYVHAYQSLLWNWAVEKAIAKGKKFEKIPLLGFGTEMEDEIKEIYEPIIIEESISLRDFILRDFPELSLEGDYRGVFADIKSLSIGEIEADDLNEGKNKIAVEFFLPKGAYATMAVRNLLN
jgi:tRNA pseudouridine13 synthase